MVDVKKIIGLEGLHILTSRVEIYYYLENDTIQVAEPQTNNSGMRQGYFFNKRHVDF